MSGRKVRWCSKPVLGIALAAMFGLAPSALQAQDAQKPKDKDFSVTVQGPDTDAGLIVSARATAKEVGMPIYPGATPHQEKCLSCSPAANLGLWGSAFGFRLVLLKLESKDAPRKIADYYQKALAKYGPVLDCTNAAPSQENNDEKSAKLTCGDDKPDKGGMLFKAGTK